MTHVQTLQHQKKKKPKNNNNNNHNHSSGSTSGNNNNSNNNKATQVMTSLLSEASVELLATETSTAAARAETATDTAKYAATASVIDVPSVASKTADTAACCASCCVRTMSKRDILGGPGVLSSHVLAPAINDLYATRPHMVRSLPVMLKKNNKNHHQPEHHPGDHPASVSAVSADDDDDDDDDGYVDIDDDDDVEDHVAGNDANKEEGTFSFDVTLSSSAAVTKDIRDCFLTLTGDLLKQSSPSPTKGQQNDEALLESFQISPEASAKVRATQEYLLQAVKQDYCPNCFYFTIATIYSATSVTDDHDTGDAEALAFWDRLAQDQNNPSNHHLHTEALRKATFKRVHEFTQTFLKHSPCFPSVVQQISEAYPAHLTVDEMERHAQRRGSGSNVVLPRLSTVDAATGSPAMRKKNKKRKKGKSPVVSAPVSPAAQAFIASDAASDSSVSDSMAMARDATARKLARRDLPAFVDPLSFDVASGMANVDDLDEDEDTDESVLGNDDVFHSPQQADNVVISAGASSVHPTPSFPESASVASDSEHELSADESSCVEYVMIESDNSLLLFSPLSVAEAVRAWNLLSVDDCFLVLDAFPILLLPESILPIQSSNTVSRVSYAIADVWPDELSFWRLSTENVALIIRRVFGLLGFLEFFAAEASASRLETLGQALEHLQTYTTPKTVITEHMAMQGKGFIELYDRYTSFVTTRGTFAGDISKDRIKAVWSHAVTFPPAVFLSVIARIFMLLTLFSGQDSCCLTTMPEVAEQQRLSFSDFCGTVPKNLRGVCSLQASKRELPQFLNTVGLIGECQRVFALLESMKSETQSFVPLSVLRELLLRRFMPSKSSSTLHVTSLSEYSSLSWVADWKKWCPLPEVLIELADAFPTPEADALRHILTGSYPHLDAATKTTNSKSSAKKKGGQAKKKATSHVDAPVTMTLSRTPSPSPLPPPAKTAAADDEDPDSVTQNHSVLSDTFEDQITVTDSLDSVSTHDSDSLLDMDHADDTRSTSAASPSTADDQLYVKEQIDSQLQQAAQCVASRKWAPAAQFYRDVIGELRACDASAASGSVSTGANVTLLHRSMYAFIVCVNRLVTDTSGGSVKIPRKFKHLASVAIKEARLLRESRVATCWAYFLFSLGSIYSKMDRKEAHLWYTRSAEILRDPRKSAKMSTEPTTFPVASHLRYRAFDDSFNIGASAHTTTEHSDSLLLSTIRQRIATLKQETAPFTSCVNSRCTMPSREIVFKTQRSNVLLGYRLRCSEGCQSLIHRHCWKPLSHRLKLGYIESTIDQSCLRRGCPGKIVLAEIVNEDGTTKKSWDVHVVNAEGQHVETPSDDGSASVGGGPVPGTRSTTLDYSAAAASGFTRSSGIKSLPAMTPLASDCESSPESTSVVAVEVTPAQDPAYLRYLEKQKEDEAQRERDRQERRLLEEEAHLKELEVRQLKQQVAMLQQQFLQQHYAAAPTSLSLHRPSFGGVATTGLNSPLLYSQMSPSPALNSLSAPPGLTQPPPGVAAGRPSDFTAASNTLWGSKSPFSWTLLPVNSNSDLFFSDSTLATGADSGLMPTTASYFSDPSLLTSSAVPPRVGPSPWIPSPIARPTGVSKGTTAIAESTRSNLSNANGFAGDVGLHNNSSNHSWPMFSHPESRSSTIGSVNDATVPGTIVSFETLEHSSTSTSTSAGDGADLPDSVQSVLSYVLT